MGKTKSLEFVPVQGLEASIKNISMKLERDGYDVDAEPIIGGKCLIEAGKGGAGAKFLGFAEGYKITLTKYDEKVILRVSNDWFGTNWLFLVGGFFLFFPFITGLIGFLGSDKKERKFFNLVASAVR